MSYPDPNTSADIGPGSGHGIPDRSAMTEQLAAVVTGGVGGVVWC